MISIEEKIEKATNKTRNIVNELGLNPLEMAYVLKNLTTETGQAICRAVDAEYKDIDKIRKEYDKMPNLGQALILQGEIIMDWLNTRRRQDDGK